jgi:hypothetical protein
MTTRARGPAAAGASGVKRVLSAPLRLLLFIADCLLAPRPWDPGGFRPGPGAR